MTEWIKLTSNTLTSTTVDFDTDEFELFEMQEWIFQLEQSGGGDAKLRCGISGSIDTGNNYAVRTSANFATDSTDPNKNGISNIDGYDNPSIGRIFMANIPNISSATSEKLLICFFVTDTDGSAGTAPFFRKSFWKWNSGTGQSNINNMIVDGGSGSELQVGTNLTITGSN